MKIIRAEKMGFCFGVTKAVDMANSLINSNPGKTIYILGMLVHNQQVINELTLKGIRFITANDIATLPEKSIVIIRAHGITYELYQTLSNKNIELYDATCIFVKKARDLIIEKEQEGFHVLFIGDENHPEVQGIVSHVKNVTLFPNLETLAHFFNEEENQKYFVMCQTTYNQTKFQEIRSFCIENLKNTAVSDTICYATHERQDAVITLAKSCDKLIVVGGKNSSNTVKLFQLAQNFNPNTIHIETAQELNLSYFSKADRIGITAGASTPETSIIEIENKLMEAFVNNQDFETLLSEYSFSLERGQKIKGIIIHKDTNYALLEIPGIKGQGKIDSKELAGFNVGDEVEVKILSTTEDFYGNIAVSRSAIEKDNAYNDILFAQTKATPITAKVIEIIPGGYKLAHNHFTFFLPKSLAPHNVNLSDSITVIIKEIKSNSNIIASHKDYQDSLIADEFSKLSIGDSLNVLIKKINANGLIVNYKNLSGFVHISEVSWENITDLNQFFKEDQQLKATIISLDAEKKGLKLSIKKLTVDPWITFTQNNTINSIVSGTVLELKPFGAIVKLENGIRGFLHKSEVAWDRFIKNINQYLTVGDMISAQIIELDNAKHSVKLSLKAIKANPWENIVEKYPLHSQVSGKITHIHDYGIFVEVEEGVEFFIYKNDIAWIHSATPKFFVGDVINFSVIEIDLEKKNLKGSIKDLSENPYKLFSTSHSIRSSVTSTVKSISDDGLFVDLGNHITGFIPKGEIEEKIVDNLNAKFKIGQEVTAQIIELDIKRQRIVLSIYKLESAQERKELDEMLKKYGV